MAPDMNRAFPTSIRPVWIASYPRSGNTFLRIILQNLFGLPTYSVYRLQGEGLADPSADALSEAPFLPRDWRQRLTDEREAAAVLIKTHGPPEPGGSAIYLVRDGYAAIDSYYHYHKRFSFEQPSLTAVIAGACQFGSWSEHFWAWQPQTRPQTLFLRYEQLVSRPNECVPFLAEFLQVEPQTGMLPTFAELKERWPEFFRRGQDNSFAQEWTPAQVSLFNELHGSVMTCLEYRLEPVSNSASAAVELAQSAARSHQLYLEQLSKLGAHAAAVHRVQEELTQIAAARDQLAEAQARLTAQLAESDTALRDLRRNGWVKLGTALGLVRSKPKPQPAAEPPSAAVTAEASSAPAPLPNLR
jgi:hypothetical protein